MRTTRQIDCYCPPYSTQPAGEASIAIAICLPPSHLVALHQHVHVLVKGGAAGCACQRHRGGLVLDVGRLAPQQWDGAADLGPALLSKEGDATETALLEHGE